MAKYYEAHKAELNTEEKRKVNFVTFALTDEQKKLAGKERVEVLQKLADKANDFNQALLEKGAEFDQGGREIPTADPGKLNHESVPGPLLKTNPQLASAAFQLSAAEPNSDALQVADGFYVLHLNGTEPARPLTLEEAKPKILEALKAERTLLMLSMKGAEIAQKIREATKSGVLIDAAIQQTGVVAEKVPPFALADPPTLPASRSPKTENRRHRPQHPISR